MCGKRQQSTHICAIKRNKNYRNNTHAYEVYLKKNFKVIEEAVADIGCGFVMDDYIMQMDIW